MKKILVYILLSVFGVTSVYSVLYYTIPAVHDFTNTKILHQEKVVDDSEDKDVKIEELLQNIVEKEEAIENLNITLEANKTQIVSLESELQLSASELEEKQNAILDLEEEIETLKATNGASEEEIASLNQQLSELIEERDSVIVELNAKVEALREKENIISGLEENISLKEVEIASLNNQIAEYESALERDPNKQYIEDVLELGSVKATKINDTNYFLVGSDYNSFRGFYLLNTLDCSVEKIINKGAIGCISKIGDNYLYSAGSYHCIFNFNTKEVLEITLSSGNYTAYDLNETYSLLSGDSSSCSLYLINKTTFEVILIKEKIFRRHNVLALSNGDFLLYQVDMASPYGFDYLDMSDFSLTTLHSNNVSIHTYEHKVNDNYSFIGSKNNTTDVVGSLFVVCVDVKEAIKLDVYVQFTETYALKDDNCLITTTDKGLGLFNRELKTVTYYGDNVVWDTFVEDENGVTITSSKNAESGSLYYSYETCEVTTVNA